MSSVNQHPTFHYSQPPDYHFSHDSVFFAREIFERHQKELTADKIKILDLCAGCGIVGMDLIFHLFKESVFFGEVDFLEVQSVYHEHFLKNKSLLQSHFPDQQLNLNWIAKSYAEPGLNKKYDFIISNPPYFLAGTGKLSPSEFKNRCRFFIDSSWQTMIRFMQNSLAEQGQAYFLVRDDLKKEIEKTFKNEVTFPFQVRGTWVAHLKK